MTTWMVRSEDGNLIPSFLADGICAIGWHEIGDPSFLDTREDFDTAIQATYPDQSVNTRSAWSSTIRRFWKEIQIDDTVVTYDPGQHIYHIGTITSAATYEESRGEWPSVRRVHWTNKIARAAATQWTRRRLGSIGTLFKVDENAAEELVALASGEPMPKPPLELQQHSVEEFAGLYQQFIREYVETDQGKEHLARYETDRATGRENFERVLQARQQGQDITDLVLDTLLPHADIGENKALGRWTCLAPVYRAAARSKHEGAGWQTPDDWPRTTGKLVDFLLICRDNPEDYEAACYRLAADPDAKGFQSATLTPMLSAISPDLYRLHNLKTRQTLRFFFGQKISQSIAAYPMANTALEMLAEELHETIALANRPDARDGDLLDMFCHWLVAEREYDFSRKYWIVKPGIDGENWSECVDRNEIRLSYGELGDLTQLELADFRARCSEISGQYAASVDRLKNLWRLRRLKEGDGVVAYRGADTVLGLGEVTSAYRYEPGSSEPHVVGVAWTSNEETRIPSYRWKSPVKSVSGELYHRAAQAISGDAQVLVTEQTFELLARLAENPVIETYKSLKDQLDTQVKEPLRKLFDGCLTLVTDEFLDTLETQQNTMSRFAKNDFGQGGVWSHLWVAAYPKGGKRIQDSRLFLEFDRDGVRMGLYVPDSDETGLKRLVERCRQPEFGDRFEGLDALGIRVGELEDKSTQPVQEWLGGARTEEVTFSVRLTPAEATQYSAKALTQKAAGIFNALYPILELALSETDPGGNGYPVAPAYPLNQFADETGFPEDELQVWADAIDRKGQAILYGPPGTGKTYVAQRLARYLVAEGTGLTQTIQFHPAYAYEDFMQGLRPVVGDDGNLSYKVLPGRFVEFCDQARGRDGLSVLIIDEINRADLSRVFGELMYLLEYRDQAIPLSGGSKPFKIPGNVRIIGTMNTADRSIALVDHAMRRRFAFMRLEPRYEILDSFHDDTAFPAMALQEVLQRINSAIGDANYHLGISYFLVPDLDRDSLQIIWQQEIEPYLEELFFDQPAKVEQARWKRVEQEIWD